MSITSDMAAAGFPGASMRYEDGGAIEVWCWNGSEIRVPGGNSLAQVQEALREANDRAKLEGDDVG